ncbi:MAG: hypothetical protein EBR07_08500, partial [Planctomycetes bacterium]|nr:hypothetical protein [Planctomycetota bacterium]
FHGVFLLSYFFNNAGIGKDSPAGFAERNGKHLPVGVQLQANAFEEDRLLRAARMLERALTATTSAHAPRV